MRLLPVFGALRCGRLPARAVIQRSGPAATLGLGVEVVHRIIVGVDVEIDATIDQLGHHPADLRPSKRNCRIKPRMSRWSRIQLCLRNALSLPMAVGVDFERCRAAIPPYSSNWLSRQRIAALSPSFLIISENFT